MNVEQDVQRVAGGQRLELTYLQRPAGGAFGRRHHPGAVLGDVVQKR